MPEVPGMREGLTGTETGVERRLMSVHFWGLWPRGEKSSSTLSQ